MSTPYDPLVALEDEPQIENGVHHPYTAFNQGWDAADQGHPLRLNPYVTGTLEARWWALGWMDQGDDGQGPTLIPPTARLARPRKEHA